METPFRKRPWYLLALVATIAAGLASRRFPEVLPSSLGKYLGDALWALMVFLGMGAILIRASSPRLGFAALGFSFGIELLKLCQVPRLAGVRHTTLGHLVFGQVFSWLNLVAHTVGVLVGVLTEVLMTMNTRAIHRRPPCDSDS